MTDDKKTRLLRSKNKVHKSRYNCYLIQLTGLLSKTCEVGTRKKVCGFSKRSFVVNNIFHHRKPR